MNISGRHMDVTDAMSETVEKYAQKLPRFDHGLMSLNVTLVSDRSEQSAEVIAKARHTTFVAKHDGHDLYDCIKLAFTKLETQIIRHNDKVKSHRAPEGVEKAPAPEEE